MNLEMPSPAEADSLRTILLIVLGVMILTIPIVFVIVISKVMAQRKHRPRGGSRETSGPSHDTGGADLTMGATGTGLFATGAMDSGQDGVPPPFSDGVEQLPHHHHGSGHEHQHQHPMGEPSSGSHDNSPSWGGDSPAMESGGGSFDSGSGGGGGDSGGGGGGGSD